MNKLLYRIFKLATEVTPQEVFKEEFMRKSTYYFAKAKEFYWNESNNNKILSFLSSNLKSDDLILLMNLETDKDNQTMEIDMARIEKIIFQLNSDLIEKLKSLPLTDVFKNMDLLGLTFALIQEIKETLIHLKENSLKHIVNNKYRESGSFDEHKSYNEQKIYKIIRIMEGIQEFKSFLDKFKFHNDWVTNKNDINDYYSRSMIIGLITLYQKLYNKDIIEKDYESMFMAIDGFESYLKKKISVGTTSKDDIDLFFIIINILSDDNKEKYLENVFDLGIKGINYVSPILTENQRELLARLANNYENYTIADYIRVNRYYFQEEIFNKHKLENIIEELDE